jgi:hypothetical protein
VVTRTCSGVATLVLYKEKASTLEACTVTQRPGSLYSWMLDNSASFMLSVML